MSKRTKSFLVIADYNLSRIQDLRQIVHHARSRHDCEVILIRSNPTELDRSIVDHVIDADARREDYLDRVLAELFAIRKQIRGVLPFSDDAVVVGARLASILNLTADDSQLAQAAFSKIEQRRGEQRHHELLRAQGIKVPASKRLSSLRDLQVFTESCARFVLKPSCEGNNRGVVIGARADRLESLYEEASVHGELGVIAEELVEFPLEASVDGLGHLYFVTEKISRASRYPVEAGQIVTATYSNEVLRAVEQAGRVANLLSGQRFGPFHNEIKCDPTTLECAVIEPNRRPGGMKIWDLAREVFGLNFYELWVDQILGREIPERLPTASGRSAIFQLKSPANFLWRKDYEETVTKSFIDEISKLGLELKSFEITANESQALRVEPRDNSEFIAQVRINDPSSRLDFYKVFENLQDRFDSIIVENCFGSREGIENENLNIA